jgi:hypothetical protein
MKIIKKYLWAFLLLLITGSGRLIAQDKKFYSDTVFELHGLKVRIEESFCVGTIVKIKFTISNPTDKLAIIYPSDIFVIAPSGQEFPTSNKKDIIIPPKDIIRKSAAFEGNEILAGAFLQLNFRKVLFGTTRMTNYDPGKIPLEVGYKVNGEAISLEVIEVDPRKRDCFVHVRVYYNRNGVLGIYPSNAVLLLINGSTSRIENKKKYYHDSSKPFFELKIKFKDIQQPGSYLLLNGVFEEYKTEKLVGLKVGMRQITAEEFKAQKVRKGKVEKQVIEEIE